jgi:hypothetical protein
MFQFREGQLNMSDGFSGWQTLRANEEMRIMPNLTLRLFDF